MKRLAPWALVLLLFGCGGAQPAPKPAGDGQPKAPAAAGSTASLLGGRLSVWLPAGAKVAPRRRSIMSAEESDEEETRVILVSGDGDLARFVMLARETFTRGTGDAVADARTWLSASKERASVGRIAAGAGLDVAGVVPEQPSGQGPLLVLAALVERPDRTIAEIGFYILPEMAAERAEFEGRARDIVKSLTAGKSTLPQKRDHRIAVDGSTLSVSLPEEFVLTRQPGPDFLVFRLRALRTIGQPPAAIGIYFGGHPSYQYQQQEIPDSGVSRSPGKLLGKDVEWLTWKAEDVTMHEAIAELGEHDFVHVFLYAEQDRLAALKTAVEAMQLSGR